MIISEGYYKRRLWRLLCELREWENSPSDDARAMRDECRVRITEVCRMMFEQDGVCDDT